MKVYQIKNQKIGMLVQEKFLKDEWLTIQESIIDMHPYEDNPPTKNLVDEMLDLKRELYLDDDLIQKLKSLSGEEKIELDNLLRRGI